LRTLRAEGAGKLCTHRSSLQKGTITLLPTFFERFGELLYTLAGAPARTSPI